MGPFHDNASRNEQGAAAAFGGPTDGIGCGLHAPYGLCGPVHVASQGRLGHARVPSTASPSHGLGPSWDRPGLRLLLQTHSHERWPHVSWARGMPGSSVRSER